MGGELFIVDDNPDNLTLLAGILREAGFTVRVANSGRRALAAVRGGVPELILLDINMPDLDGYAVCAELKRDPVTRDVPVVFLSALDDVRDKVEAFEAGGVDYITKPFQAEEVLARVRTQLGLSRLRRQLEDKNAELARKNEELLSAWRHADEIFAALSDVLTGAILDGKYRLGERIGAGGAAAVYRATRIADGQPAAVKVLRPRPGRDDEKPRRRAEEERRLATRVAHPGAVTILDGGITASGIEWIAMELLVGRTLADELAGGRRLPLARSAALLLPVCDVLAEAHAHGIVHRDVKPANIFLHAGPGGEVVKLLDFGISALVLDGDSELTGTAHTRFTGTPVYMSPERLLGKRSDHRADVYALAMTLYETLAGMLPFRPTDGGLGAIIVACVSDEPLSLRAVRPDVPAALSDTIMRALKKRPVERPPLQELASALAAIKP